MIRCVDVVVPRLHDPDHFNFYADLGRAKRIDKSLEARTLSTPADFEDARETWAA